MEYLIVLNKDEDSISIIDLKTDEEVKKIPTDYNPHEVVISPDKKKTFVTCSLGNSLYVISNDNFEVIDIIKHEGFNFPHGLAISKEKNELYLASTYSNKFYVFDVDTHEIKKIIDTHQDKSHMVTLSPDETSAYIPNIGSGNITEYDTNDGSIKTHFPVGNGPEGLAIYKNGDIYSANQEDDRVVVYDKDTYEEKFSIRVGHVPIRAMFSPDYKYLFVPNRESNDLSIIVPEYSFCGKIRPYEIKRIPLGTWTGGIVFDDDSAHAYVANNKTNDISAICMRQLIEFKRIKAGIHPDGIAYLNKGTQIK